MLTSKAWRHRLAQKSSALGIVSTLVLFVGAVLMAAPAQAAVVAQKDIVYTNCTGSLLKTGTTSLTVKLSAPASTPTGQSFNATLGIPQLTLQTAATASARVQVTATLAVTGGTGGVFTNAQAGTVGSDGLTVPAADVTSSVTPTATDKVSIKPAPTLTLSLAGAANLTATCTTTSTEVVDVTIGTGGGTGDDVIKYNCALSTTGTDVDYPADVDMKVTLTMPTDAKANVDASITWAGVVQTTGDPLKIPAAGVPSGSKFFATVKSSGAGTLATATGEGTLNTTTAGGTIIPPSITMKVKPTTTGTVTITPSDLVIGTSATSTTAGTIKCLVAADDTPKTYTFTVAAANGTSPSPSPSTTPTTPKPTTTKTVTVTKTPVGGGKVTKTPKAGAETGGGGDMGPDGRMFVLVGSVLVMGAGVGGLMLRRRSVSRG